LARQGISCCCAAPRYRRLRILSLRSKQSNDEPAPIWWAAGSIAFACLAALPLFLSSGFLNTRGGGDSPFLLFRLHEITVALQEGVFPVRWMPNAAFGMGYPFFNYYAALPYYFAALFRLFGFSFVFSLKLTQLAGFAVAGIGMYAWVHRTTGRRSIALLASAAYTFAPFHMVNIYVRGDSLAEFWAMAWYPLILLSIYEASQKPSTQRVGLVALAYSALVMTHNVSALLFSPFVVIYALGCAVTGPGDQSSHRALHLPVKHILLLTGGGILGLILAAWVWLPAIAEQDFVQLGEQTTGYFFYANHFRSDDLIQSSLLFDYDTGRESSTPFSMGHVQALLTLVGAVAMTIHMIREKTRWRGGFVLAGLVLSTLMITPLSEPVWAHAPLLPFAQFPWRFLSIQALFSAATIGALATPLAAHQGAQENWRGPLALAGALGLMLAAATLGSLNPNFIPLNDADVTPQRLQWYESFSGNIGTTIRYEYLPRWTMPRPYTSDILLQRDPRAKFLRGEGTAQRIEAGAASQEWQISVSTVDADVALPLLYFPGWQAEIDGEFRPVQPVDGIGYVRLTVPQGDHTVRLWLGYTPIRLWAEIASVLGLTALAVLMRPRLPRWDWVAWSLVAGGIMTLFSLAMLLNALPQPAPLPGPLNADFAQEAYFHHSPGGILFQDGLRLLEGQEFLWEWLPDNPESRGDSWAFTPLPPHVEQGALRHGFHEEGRGYTPGVYFRELWRDQAPALTSSGESRGPIYLYPIFLNEPHSPFWADDSKLDLKLGSITLLGYEMDMRVQYVQHIEVDLLWTTAHELEKNYAISLRLYDEASNQWAVQDVPTLTAGMYPTGMWKPSERVLDQYALDLPEGAPPGIYRLHIIIYDAVTLVPIGETDIPIEYQYVNRYSRLTNVHGQMMTEEIGIETAFISEVVEQGSRLETVVGWFSLEPPNQHYEAVWRLQRGNEIIWEMQSPLAPGSDPMQWSEWYSKTAYVLGKNHMIIPASVETGDYVLSVQLVDEAGNPVGQSYKAGDVEITLSDRLFDVPPLDHALDIMFGNQVRLWGYSVEQTSQALTLDVAWGAINNPAADYKYFVHLIDLTGAIVAQVDAMPLNFTYPTSQWLVGEVVPETIALDLSSVPPGEYSIALGWYESNSGTRLHPGGEGVEIATDGRVILPDSIVIE
jgi:hypothetical protein